MAVETENQRIAIQTGNVSKKLQGVDQKRVFTAAVLRYKIYRHTEL